MKPVIVNFLLIASFILLFSPFPAYSQPTGLVGEELLRLNMSVIRGSQTLSVDQVPMFKENDRLKISLLDEANNEGITFDERGYSSLIVFFLPISTQTTAYRNRDFSMQIRKISSSDPIKNAQLRSGATNSNSEKGFCFTNCLFIAPKYRSVPIIFLVANENSGIRSWLNSSGYKNDLKTFIVASNQSAEGALPVSNYDMLMSFGERSVNLTVLPKKVEFLVEAMKILETPKSENSKVLQSLTDRAFNYFELGKGNECENELGNNLRETVKKRFTCLINPENLSSFNFAEFNSKINWASLVQQLSSESVSQLKAKYPSFNVYVDAAIMIVNLIEPFLRQLPLVISSSILARRSENTTLSLYANPFLSTSTPSSSYSQALFFVPFRFRKESELITASEVAVLRPETLEPCIKSGGNNLSFISSTINESKVLEKLGSETANHDLKLRLSPTAQSQISETFDVNPNTWKFIVSDDAITKMKQWNSITGQVEYKYGFERLKTASFFPTVDTVERVSFIGEPTLRMENENRITISYSGSPNCIEKLTVRSGDATISEVRTDSNKNWKLDSEKKQISFTIDIAQISAADTKHSEINIHKYGEKDPILTSRILISPPQSQIKRLEMYEGENFAHIDFGELSLEQFDDIEFVEIADVKLKLDEIKSKRAYLIDSQSQIIEGDHIAKLRFTNGQSSKPKTVTISPPRIKLFNSHCPSPNKSIEFIAARWSPMSDEYQIDDCSHIPLSLQEFEVSINPSNPRYDFIEKETKVVAKLENVGYLDACGSSKEVPIGSNAISIVSKLSREIIIRVNIGNLPKEVACPGWRMRIQLFDRDGNKTFFHTIEQRFIELPVNPVLDCSQEFSESCFIRADDNTLSRVSSVLVSNVMAGNSQDWIKIDKLNVPIPKPTTRDGVWLRLRSGEIVQLSSSQIKLPIQTEDNTN